MDPITAAIIAAIAAGVTTKFAESTTEAVGSAIKESYAKLKALLNSKFGEKSEVVEAVAKLEAAPDSAGRRGVLQEEVAKAKAADDPKIIEAAEGLREQLKALPGASQVFQQAIGSNIAQASGGSTATVNVNTPPQK